MEAMHHSSKQRMLNQFGALVLRARQNPIEHVAAVGKERCHHEIRNRNPHPRNQADQQAVANLPQQPSINEVRNTQVQGDWRDFLHGNKQIRIECGMDIDLFNSWLRSNVSMIHGET
jgi:hypothetical protein